MFLGSQTSPKPIGNIGVDSQTDKHISFSIILMNNILIDRYAERTGISIIIFLKEKGLWESVVNAFDPWIYLQELKAEHPYKLEALGKQPVIDYVEQRAKDDLANA